MRYAKHCAGDLLLGYERAQANGYGRSYGCFKRTASQVLRPKKRGGKRTSRISEQNTQGRRFGYRLSQATPPQIILFCCPSDCVYTEFETELRLAQSQILCKLPTRREQIRIQCARQRIYPTAACVQYNAGGDGCQGDGKAAVHRSAVQRRADP